MRKSCSVDTSGMPQTTAKIRLQGPILAIDDDEGYRKELKDILDRRNIPCVISESANHCLRFIQAQPWNWKPSMVITDIVMGGMGGYQLMRRIQELYRGRNVPIIVISRLNSGIDIGEAESAGASAYLNKPLDEENLVHAIERMCNPERKGMFVFTHEQGGRVVTR